MQQAPSYVHKPVLLQETLDALSPRKPQPFFVDGTLGQGGHSEAYLSRFADSTVAGLDADADIIKIAESRLASFGGRVSF
jgi:16S rRNA (cytosine1402-N4)-methyltransferase